MAVGARLTEGVLWVTIDGAFTSEELRDAVIPVVLAADFRGPVPALFDGRLGPGNATIDDMEERARLAASRPDLIGPRVAALVATPLQHGLARMGGAFADMQGLEVAVFHELEAALAWLREGDSNARPAATDAADPPRPAP